jgi:dihydropteroate synthase type 2
LGSGATFLAGRGGLKTERVRIRAPRIFGILNLSPESFSDGGLYHEPSAALAHARVLLERGADVIDVGAAASNAAAPVLSPEEEIARLEPVLPELLRAGVDVSVDSACATAQRYALERGVGYLNDVSGFADEALYEHLAASPVKLIVMHAMTGERAQLRDTRPGEVTESLWRFFDRRLEALSRAGVRRERIILDPGMGLFLGRGAAPSIEALRNLGELRRRYQLPVMVSVSRKSFLGEITGRPVGERAAATVAAELFAVAHGADYVRTHDPGALRDALAVDRALRG